MKTLTKIRGWLASSTIPWFKPFWRAKMLHEKSPYGLFSKGSCLYSDLSKDDIDAAINCPKLSEAISLYNECIELERKENRVFNEAIALHQLGLALFRQGKIEEAEIVFRDAVKILNDLPQSDAVPAISTCYFRLAEIENLKGNSENAIEYLDKSLKIDQSIEDKGGILMNKALRKIICENHH